MDLRSSRFTEMIGQLKDYLVPTHGTIMIVTLYVLLVLLFLCSFNQLDLPPYETYNKLRTQLLLAIRECPEGFGFA